MMEENNPEKELTHSPSDELAEATESVNSQDTGDVVAASEKPVAVSLEQKSFFKAHALQIGLGLLALVLVIGGGALAFLGGGSDDTNESPKLDFEGFAYEDEVNLEEQTEETTDYSGSYTLKNEETGTEVAVTVDSGNRTITANGLPNHSTGEFPNDASPNAISAQNYSFVLPLDPVKKDEPSSYNIETIFGIAINGVLFDRYVAEYYSNNPNSGWQKAGIINDFGFDFNNAHVDADGAYHYNGNPTSLITDFEPQLLGFAADGFPIYSQFSYSKANDVKSTVVKLKSSYKLKEGTRPDGPGG
ncbi:MAG: YHYH protein, partial [Candidatus Saccharimonadales bacterium]|nr:YHYH protein [Candidatus Saccharimonadales bacterium]